MPLSVSHKTRRCRLHIVSIKDLLQAPVQIHDTEMIIGILNSIIQKALSYWSKPANPERKSTLNCLNNFKPQIFINGQLNIHI